ncbi:uncharacterized protein LOC120256909 [Dioscorea cayenensis subsp. rotundata]|uniref:Uncharacterized protein LOC120256909 n=1 Tax=Dioscorea cayennensis subsp. rotundata TaxID=55577 RepID=A0AB40AZB0_DIOCR|nr:uncharacterized protein LOC120256909 [Dioscorea cayenensis subsp. rotundata]
MVDTIPVTVEPATSVSPVDVIAMGAAEKIIDSVVNEIMATVEPAADSAVSKTDTIPQQQEACKDMSPADAVIVPASKDDAAEVSKGEGEDREEKMRTKRMARRAPPTPQEIAARIAEVRMRGTDSGGSPPRREESEDLGKAIVPYVSSQDAEVREAGTSSQDLPSGVKDRDDLLRWVRESFPGAYVQRAEEDEQEDSTTVLVGEGSEEQQARDEDAAEKEPDRAQAEEIVGERSTDAPTSAKEEVATILSEVLESSHSSDEIPLKDRVAQIAKGKKKKEKVSKSKRKSFSDPEVEASPRHKRKCTEVAKQGEKPSASSKKEKKKKATQQAKDSDEDRFHGKASKKKFESVEGRGVVVERMIDEGAFEKYGLTELLQQRSLYKSATFPESYSLPLVHEFYNNLLPSDKGITRVYVRGKWIPFTPTCLNKFLEFKPEVKGNYEEGLELNEEVLKEITGGRTESWGEETRLPASTLTPKYNVLFRLGIRDWLPTRTIPSIVKELALLLFAIGNWEEICSTCSTTQEWRSSHNSKEVENFSEAIQPSYNTDWDTDYTDTDTTSTGEQRPGLVQDII